MSGIAITCKGTISGVTGYVVNYLKSGDFQSKMRDSTWNFFRSEIKQYGIMLRQFFKQAYYIQHYQLFSKNIIWFGIFAMIFSGISAIPSIHAQTSTQFNNMLSSSYPATITVTGQGSKWIEPDKVTVSLNLQSKWKNSTSFASSQKEAVQQVVDSIKSVLPNATISMGQVTINPYNNGQLPGSLKYQSYSLVHATADMATFENIASKFGQAGISIQDATIMQVPSNQTQQGNLTHVSISAGSGMGQTCVASGTCYMPQKISISTGTTVVWSNDDRVGHTVTSGSPSDATTGSTFDSSLIAPSKDFSYTFLNPGTFEYFCQVHPWMTGLVTVTGKSLVPTGEEGAKYKVIFSIPINTVPDTLGNTTAQYREMIDKVKGILNAGGIPDSDISIDPLRINSVNYGPSVASEYDINSAFFVDTSLNDLPKVIKIADNAGANIGSITMAVSQKALDSAKQELAGEALDDSLAQATKIAQAGGLAVKSIKDIQLSPLESQNNPVQYDGRMPVMVTQPSTAGQFYVTATVQFEIGK